MSAAMNSRLFEKSVCRHLSIISGRETGSIFMDDDVRNFTKDRKCGRPKKRSRILKELPKVESTRFASAGIDAFTLLVSDWIRSNPTRKRAHVAKRRRKKRTRLESYCDLFGHIVNQGRRRLPRRRDDLCDLFSAANK